MRWPWRRPGQGFVLVPEDYWDRITARLGLARGLRHDALGQTPESYVLDCAQLHADIVAMHIGEKRL